MFGASAITDQMVQAAAGGLSAERDRILQAMKPQVAAMVAVRLSPTPTQFSAVDDLCQQVLMAVVEGLGTLRCHTTAALKSYASTIVSRKVADYLRGPERQRARSVRSLDSSLQGASGWGTLADCVPGNGNSPSSLIGRSEQIARMLAELGRLRAYYREIITLAFFDQLPLAEIAERLGMSRSRASMTLLRAVKALRRSLTGSSKVVQEPCR